MNEFSIIVGMDREGTGYFAMFANEGYVCGEDTPEEAIKGLLKTQYPTIWHINDEDEKNPCNKTEIIIDGKPKTIGMLKSRYVNKGKLDKYRKLTNKEIVEILYHNHIDLDPRVKEVGLQDGTKLFLINGELNTNNTEKLKEE